ncbi:hypothetical protein B0J17DRAFT_263175 [Rhizoctonia solani]|nr:hypothetical protein B0J17DRAFT_263175 [Rhizoctonia solani]
MLDDPALKSESIYFATLSGEEVTHESIKQSIAQLFHASEALGLFDHAKIFVYLTGEGDYRNRMCLSKKETISKEDINGWLLELRGTWGYNRPITLVFDICRSNGNEQEARMHHGIELISSCSAGQQSQAIRFKFNQDIPYSCFFLAFVIASFDSSGGTTFSFKDEIERRLNQFIGLMRSNPSSNISEEINEGPGPQEPDWSQAGNPSTFLELAIMLSRTKIAREARALAIKYLPVEVYRYLLYSGIRNSTRRPHNIPPPRCK